MMDELDSIAAQMNALLPEFKQGNALGLFLPTEFAAKFRALAIEAKSILDDELGRLNEFSTGLLRAVNGIDEEPSYASVEESAEIVRSSVRAVARKRAKPTAAVEARPFVDAARIAELLALTGGKWDFTRLLALCRELNVASANDCHLATAMLLRAILDHVPPIFGFKAFEQVANNYGGGRSFKAAIERLQGAARNIADMHLHDPIREKEVVPTAVQVGFAPELDILLSEIVRVSR